MRLYKLLFTALNTYILLVLFILLQGSAQARYFNTIYWMNGIPQSSYGNPAQFPQARAYMGIPMASSFYLGVANKGYMLSDLLLPDPVSKYFWDVDHFLGRLNGYNLSHANLHLDIISAGFRHNNNYYSLGITEKVVTRVGYTADFVRLATQGSEYFHAGYLSAELNELALDVTHYREYSAGVSRQVSANVALGVRAKMLTGLSGAFMKYSNLHIRPDLATGSMMVHADMLLNTSGAEDFIASDNSGNEASMPGSGSGYMTNLGNRGLAIDIGTQYQLSDQLNLAFSLLDVGFINWRSKVENLYITERSSIDGIELQSLFEGNLIDNATTLSDTIDLDFVRRSQYDSFRHFLSPTFIASAAYELNNNHRIAMLAQNLIHKEKLYPTLSLSYHISYRDRGGLSASYSLVHMNYSNIGLGFFINIGRLQAYVVSDNILSAFIPHKVQMTSLHAGFNLLFGKREARVKLPPGLFCW